MMEDPVIIPLADAPIKAVGSDSFADDDSVIKSEYAPSIFKSEYSETKSETTEIKFDFDGNESGIANGSSIGEVEDNTELEIEEIESLDEVDIPLGPHDTLDRPMKARLDI